MRRRNYVRAVVGALVSHAVLMGWWWAAFRSEPDRTFAAIAYAGWLLLALTFAPALGIAAALGTTRSPGAVRTALLAAGLTATLMLTAGWSLMPAFSNPDWRNAAVPAALTVVAVVLACWFSQLWLRRTDAAAPQRSARRRS